MPRAKNAYSKDAAAIAPDDDETNNGAAARQRISIVSAASVAPPQTSGARSVFDIAGKPKKRSGPRASLPPIDVAALVIESGVEKPVRSRFCVRGQSKYEAIFAALQPGQSVQLPAAYYGAVYAAAKKRKSEHYTMRRVSETHCRLWRDK